MLRRLGFPGPGFTTTQVERRAMRRRWMSKGGEREGRPDEDTLVVGGLEHEVVGLVGNGVDMGGEEIDSGRLV